MIQRTIDDSGKMTIKLTAEDLDIALVEYEKYMNMESDLFYTSWCNYPTPSSFFAIYFGRSTSDTEPGYHMPEEYICNSHESALKLAEKLKKIEFVSKIDGTTCEVVVDKKLIHVIYTDAIDVDYVFGLDS